MSKKKKSPKKAKRGASAGTPGPEPSFEQAPSKAQRLFLAGDYLAASAACGEEDEELKARLAVDSLFIYIYTGGLALIGVLGALTMR